MKKLKWLSFMLIFILMTSCGKSLEEKIEDGDDLTKDDYKELLDYTMAAMNELNEINQTKFHNEEELSDLQESALNISSEYPEVPTYVTLLAAAEASNDPEIREITKSSNYKRLQSYIDRGWLSFWMLQ